MIRFDISDCDPESIARLRDELGVSDALAQVLVRRGYEDPLRARAFLAADEHHELESFAGLSDAAETILAAARTGRRITIHGDYDVDGVCSTALLLRTLRKLRANVDWYLPDRAEGYGLSQDTVRASGPARHEPARNGRLRYHGCGGGGACALAWHRGDRQRPSPAARRRQAAGRTDRAPAAVRLSLPRSLRCRGRAQARPGDTSGCRARPPRGRRRPRPGGACDDRRRGPAAWREPQHRAARATCAGGHRQAWVACADGRRTDRAWQGERARRGLRAGASHQRLRTPLPCRRGARADPHTRTRRAPPRSPTSSTGPTASAGRPSLRSACRPKRRSPSWRTRTIAAPMCSRARAGIAA